MQKSDLELERLMELLEQAKLAEGKTEKTIQWYRRSMHSYTQWLTSKNLPCTLANFTLELVRAYIVDLYKRPAYQFHPVCKVKDHSLSDHTINSMVRALRAISNWLHAEQYSSEPGLGAASHAKDKQEGSGHSLFR